LVCSEPPPSRRAAEACRLPLGLLATAGSSGCGCHPLPGYRAIRPLVHMRSRRGRPGRGGGRRDGDFRMCRRPPIRHSIGELAAVATSPDSCAAVSAGHRAGVRPELPCAHEIGPSGADCDQQRPAALPGVVQAGLCHALAGRHHRCRIQPLASYASRAAATKSSPVNRRSSSQSTMPGRRSRMIVGL